ncbi:HD domain-containing protein [Brevundimonas aveniformis]|uniref:HD domain-containing protein n=1 Tax=Brevundimonas aveniformis TaxID=370977 RepID=UPI002490C5E3|nr:HD domain-containing protein [Brevundimonas aveniformis]
MVRIAAIASLIGLGSIGPAWAQDPPPSEPPVVIADLRIEPWHGAVFEQASRFQHPSWGERHAQRNLRTAMAIAQAEGLSVDYDVLTAAAYLHDWGGLEPYEVEGVPHQIRSVELAEPFLREAGFPMEKWPAVRDAILGHVPSGQPTTPEGIVLHDADLLDFMGAEGIARFLAAPSDQPTVDQGLSYIEDFGLTLGDRLITNEARRLAEPRLTYMSGFLEQLRSELPPGTQP